MLLFSFLLVFFSGVYVIYFAYIKIYIKRPWKSKIDRDFQPKISILVPVHNEENTIELKLKNIRAVSYPKEKIEVIVADDASKDNTLEKVQNFIENNGDLHVKIVRQESRGGKSAALNNALTFCASQIVIVSDSDTQWPSDILQKALPYLEDPAIGAVTSMGVNRNDYQSWVIEGENTYLRFASLLRLGESKIHSTIRFEGGFCAYKRDAFEKFDNETGADDSGTALEVVQHNFRSILVPGVIFFTDFPTRLSSKLQVKARRANQLLSLWMKCLRLLLKRQLLLPKRIAVPEMMLFIFNPMILLALIISASSLIVLYPLSLFSLVIVLAIIGLLIFARRVFVEILLDNLILLYSLVALIFGKHYVAWEKTD
jgi:cellulose synthase/poly-beta-1,6-N-acetylglucosamine synthase-like glycosyltransferase